MMFYVYILESESSGRLYIGQTNNLQDKIYRHNSNQNLPTKNKGPWKLIFSKEFDSRSEAVHLERKLRAWKNQAKVVQITEIFTKCIN